MKKNSRDNLDNFKIETERLILRPFTMNDLDDFSLICADLEVMQYIGDGKPQDRMMVKERLLQWISLYKEQGYGVLAITLKDNNKLLGFCALMQQTVDEELHIELGYRLDKAYWRQGFMTEAATALRDYAFKRLQIHQLISIIHIDNAASKRVAQKVGMKPLKRTSFKGVLVDVFYMESNLN